MQTRVRIILTVVLGVSISAWVKAADLHESGQQTCYDETGNQLTECTGTLQDGDLMPGIAWPSPRFIRGTGNESNCIIDRLTGLMWVRNPLDVALDWLTAVDTAGSSTICGHSDWRLPNVIEMHSLVNYDVADSAAWLNAQGFGDNILNHEMHWTSTTFSPDPATAWIVNLDVSNGNSAPAGVFGKSALNYILPVRSIN